MRNRLLAVIFLLAVGLLLSGCKGTENPSQQASAPVPSEDGYGLWLRYAPPGSICNQYRDAIQQIVVPGNSETSRVIGRELCSAVNAVTGSSLSPIETWSRKPALIVGTPSNSESIRGLGFGRFQIRCRSVVVVHDLLLSFATVIGRFKIRDRPDPSVLSIYHRIGSPITGAARAWKARM